jgi:branched-chain amino acid transport system ATP-binding protein
MSTKEYGNTALETHDLSIVFGGYPAVDGVSLQVAEGEFLSVIGPNGAGKTTFFNLLSGQLRPSRGRVVVYGQDVTSLPPHRRARLGLGRSFQLTSVYPTLTVLENVRLSVQAREGRNQSLFRPGRHPAMRRQEEEAADLLQQVQLDGRALQTAGTLSHGDQRKLEIAMLLGLGTKILLLDEPTAGMSLDEVPTMVGLLEGIKAQGGRTIILIEHKMDIVTRLSDRIAVLAGGRLLTVGNPAAIAADPEVQAVYLGGSHATVTPTG